jgi:hypothetical protein
MFRFLCLLPVLFLVACATVPVTDVSEPAQAARAFYSEVHARNVMGLPEGADWRALKPRMTPRLVADFEAARRQQRVFMRHNPDEKPPWIEGDLFGSLFEGPTSFRIGDAKVSGDRAEVPVFLEYRSATGREHWQDMLILQRTGRGWLIDDVRYEGNWPFATSGTLTEVLTSEGC